jgi:hypothetical protein
LKQTSKWDEKTARAYLYWTPNSKLSTRLEIFYEHLNRDATFGNPSGIRKTDSYRVPMSLHYFHPGGLFATLKGTYLKQEGEFGDVGDGFLPGSDKFWVFDALVGFRFSKRLGIFTVEARNLFDEVFLFQDIDPANPATVPERAILGRVTISY